MSEVRQALRQVLRAVDQHLTSVNGNKQWRDHVIKEFRSAANSGSPALQKQKLQEAKDYAYLVNSVQEHRVSCAHSSAANLAVYLPRAKNRASFALQALLLSYNIGVDREQERRKLMSDTAARVGLRMPKYAEENDTS